MGKIVIWTYSWITYFTSSCLSPSPPQFSCPYYLIWKRNWAEWTQKKNNWMLWGNPVRNKWLLRDGEQINCNWLYPSHGTCSSLFTQLSENANPKWSNTWWILKWLATKILKTKQLIYSRMSLYHLNTEQGHLKHNYSLWTLFYTIIMVDKLHYGLWLRKY